jgi:hypothetical protein
MSVLLLVITLFVIEFVQAFPGFGNEIHQKKVKELNVNFTSRFSEFAWNPPTSGDSRGPCPALNSLANHGILSHDGKQITKDALVKALATTFNVDSTLAGKLVDTAFNQLGTDGSDGVRKLDLVSLNTHGVIEHDASLTRNDLGDAGNDNFTPQQSLVDQLKTFVVNGNLDFTGIAKARLLRIQQEKKSDPNFNNGLQESLTALGEAVIAIRLLGDGQVLPARWMDTWFIQEQIPSDWKPLNNTYGPVQFAADLAYLKLCITKLSFGGSTC